MQPPPRTSNATSRGRALWAALVVFSAYPLVALFVALPRMPAGAAISLAVRSIPFAMVVGAAVFGIARLRQRPVFDWDDFSHVAEPLLRVHADKIPENETALFLGSIRIAHRGEAMAEWMTGRTAFPARLSSGTDGVRVAPLLHGNAVFIPWDQVQIKGARLWKAVEVRMDCVGAPSLTVTLTATEEAAAVLFPELVVTGAAKPPVLLWLSLAAALTVAAMLFRLL